MKIVATLLVRDEEETLKEHLDFHLANGISCYLVTDNKSSDRTRSIISDYFHNGVTWFAYSAADDYPQSELVSRMARKALNYEPDWIVHMDADEFWHGLNTLEHVDPSWRSVRCPIYDHLPSRDCKSGPIDRSIMPLRVGPRQYKVAHRPLGDPRIQMGNHDLEGAASPFWYDVHIEHYPIRSYEQFERKVLNAERVLANGNHAPTICTHWKRWIDLYHRGMLRLEYESMTQGKLVD